MAPLGKAHTAHLILTTGEEIKAAGSLAGLSGTDSSAGCWLVVWAGVPAPDR
jgi:hypothetical protein